jgi:hypothetical protein
VAEQAAQGHRLGGGLRTGRHTPRAQQGVHIGIETQLALFDEFLRTDAGHRLADARRLHQRGGGKRLRSACLRHAPGVRPDELALVDHGHAEAGHAVVVHAIGQAHRLRALGHLRRQQAALDAGDARVNGRTLRHCDHAGQ